MTNSIENNQPSNDSSSEEYYDLITIGSGYINRIREVDVPRGDNFYSCNISARRGTKSAKEYTYFDCRVVGSDAIKVIKRLVKADKEEKQILMGFRIGDQYPDPFVYQKGQKKGETGYCTKARLIYIGWVNVDGQRVYTAPKKDELAQDEAPKLDAPVTTRENIEELTAEC
jgi:hypothetical protein